MAGGGAVLTPMVVSLPTAQLYVVERSIPMVDVKPAVRPSLQSQYKVADPVWPSKSDCASLVKAHEVIDAPLVTAGELRALVVGDVALALLVELAEIESSELPDAIGDVAPLFAELVEVPTVPLLELVSGNAVLPEFECEVETLA